MLKWGIAEQFDYRTYKGGYYLSPVLQRSLRLDLWYNDQQKYTALCNAVIRYWERQLIEGHGDLNQPVLECLYQYINVLRTTSMSQDEVLKKTVQQLQGYLSRYLLVSKEKGFDNSMKLRQALEDDEEFKEHMGSHFDALLQEASSLAYNVRPQ